MKTGGRAEYSGSLDSIVMAVIVIEPAIEGPFVSNCIQMSLMVSTVQNDPLASFMRWNRWQIKAIWPYLGVWSVGAVFKWRSLSLAKSAYWFRRDAFVWRWIIDNTLFFGSSDPSSESSVNVALSRPSFKRNFVMLYQVWKKFNELSLFDFVYCSIGWIQTDELFRYVRFLFV